MAFILRFTIHLHCTICTKQKPKFIHLLAYEIQSTNSIRFIIVIFIIGIVIFRTKTNWFFRLMFYVHWISLWNWHWCECMFAITDSKHAWGWSAFRLHFSFDLTLLTLDHSIRTSTWGDESKQSKIDGRLLSTEKLLQNVGTFHSEWRPIDTFLKSHS